MFRPSLKNHFLEERVISRHFPDPCPPRSPDRNPVLYSFEIVLHMKYISSYVSAILKNHFPEERVISLHFPDPCPPRSPDLNPVLYSFEIVLIM